MEWENAKEQDDNQGTGLWLPTAKFIAYLEKIAKEMHDAIESTKSYVK